MIFSPFIYMLKKAKKISKKICDPFMPDLNLQRIMPDAIMRSLGIIPDGIDVTIMTVVNTLSRVYKGSQKAPVRKAVS